MSNPDVTIVLPAHNEVSMLGSTVTHLMTGLAQRKENYELIVVENGSRDGTLSLARVLAAQIPELRVLTLPRGDYGAALLAGFRAARGKIVVNFDVDYYSLAFYDAAVALIRDSKAHLVLASKRIIGASDRRPMPRRLLTSGFAMASRSALHLEVSDAHGMKAMDKNATAPVVEHCVMRGSLYDVELVLRAIQSGLTVEELPAAVSERRPPRTSIAARSLEGLVGLVRLRHVIRAEALRASRENEPEQGRATNSFRELD